MTKKELLDYLQNYLSDGKPHTIRIFGHGASGKSHLAKELLATLPIEDVNLLETDPYIISGDWRQLVVPRDFPTQKVTASMPIAHELNSLTRDIKALQTGIDVLTIDEPWAPSQLLKASKPILIVEGMSAGFLDSNLFDLSILLKTDSDTELKRRLDRDINHRQRQADFVIDTHQTRRQQYDYYYKVTEGRADIILEQKGDKLIITSLT